MFKRTFTKFYILSHCIAKNTTVISASTFDMQQEKVTNWRPTFYAIVLWTAFFAITGIVFDMSVEGCYSCNNDMFHFFV